MQQRLYYLDSLKGLLIILVILGHALDCFPNPDGHWLHLLIYSFHLPLFLFISGYLSNKGKYKAGVVSRRAKQLVVPMLTWAVLEPVLLTGRLDWTTTWDMILNPGHQGLWFLDSLFLFTASFSLLEWIRQRFKLPLRYGFLSFLVVLYALKLLLGNVFALSLSAYMVIYFALGYYCKSNDKLLNMNGLILGGGFIILYILRLIDCESCCQAPVAYVLNYVHSYLMGITGSLLLLQLGKRYLNQPGLWIQRFGLCSLGIYVTQFFVLHHLAIIMHPLREMGFPIYGFIFIRTALTTVICYLLVIIVRKVKYLRTLLIGD